MSGFWAYDKDGNNPLFTDDAAKAIEHAEDLITRGFGSSTVIYSEHGEIPEEAKHPGNYTERQSDFLTALNNFGGCSSDDDDDNNTTTRNPGRAVRSMLDAYNGAGKRRKK